MVGEMYDWSEHVLNEIDELYKAVASSGPLPWKKITLSLRTCIESVGGITRLAHLMKMSRREISSWLRGTCRLPLESILLLCYVLNIPLVELITNDQKALKEALQGGKMIQPSPRVRLAPLPSNREIVLEAIQLALVNEEIPLSLSQIARNLNKSRTTIEKLFPQESALIIAKYRNYVQKRKKCLMQSRCDEIRQVVLTLYEQGIYPSHGKVGRMLSTNSRILGTLEGRATWHAVRQELGIEYF